MAILTILGTLALGFATAFAVATIIFCYFLAAVWVKEQIKKRLENTQKHKVAFADARRIVKDEYQNAGKEIPISLLENLDETPYVIVNMDKFTNELSNMERIKAESVNENFINNLEKKGGILVFE